MRIIIVGSGYVGMVTGAIPIYEPGLDEIVRVKYPNNKNLLK